MFIIGSSEAKTPELQDLDATYPVLQNKDK